MKVLCEGLGFPEGPVAMEDGSVVLVDIHGGTLLRVSPQGERSVIAKLGGGPNGAAIGPDGACYVCNNGGFEWHRDDDGQIRPGLQPENYSGGRIERVDLATGEVTVLYTETEHGRLRGPNDLVFDKHGGFWFTDHGKRRPREMDHGGVYYARIDGSLVRQVVYPLLSPNGIGLSPSGDTLYVAETTPGRLWSFDITAPGEVALKPFPSRNGGTLVAGLPGEQYLDSLAVEANGNICVATLFNGGITVISPDGSSIEHIPLPDRYTTNICFGGKDGRRAFVTLSATGRLVELEWPRPGLRLNWS